MCFIVTSYAPIIHLFCISSTTKFANEKAQVNAGDTAFRICVEFSAYSTTKSITSFDVRLSISCALMPGERKAAELAGVELLY